jgi:hypothetical protein
MIHPIPLNTKTPDDPVLSNAIPPKNAPAEAASWMDAT